MELNSTVRLTNVNL